MPYRPPATPAQVAAGFALFAVLRLLPWVGGVVTALVRGEAVAGQVKECQAVAPSGASRA